MKKSYFKFIAFLLVYLIALTVTGCGQKEIASARSTGKEEYENQMIVIQCPNDVEKKVTVSEMRKLDQIEFDASLTRTTGLLEEFKAAGPTMKDVLALVDEDISDYKALGFFGRDGYYCLVTPEIIENFELVLALAIDDNPELPADTRPARLCIQGEFGPYWVRMVERIVLYDQIPQKDIKSVWVFKNLIEGIQPYEYEYYGSEDDAIELVQVFARFDEINNEAFFTMKSADGFLKNEAMNVVSQGYYIKIEGEGAPMNISPYIRLGMNVKHIAWFSTNADAAIFPEQMADLLGETEIEGQKGVLLGEILEEVRVKDIESKQFELFDVDGERLTVTGADLYKGLLIPKGNGTYNVNWDKQTELAPIENLLRIKAVE
ncbi:MAG: hypothetical protein GX759_06045 [Thermoanaerobacterales bacterium]|nr:hypothetical protein [Thermoanaerobacterales bacterium]